MPPRQKLARKSKPKSRPRSRHGAGKSPRAPKSRPRAASLQSNSAGEWFEKLVALQTRLRAPGGCPWDREQTHESLRRFLVEETYEVLDAMETGTPREFASELGDLLLQVVFHSVLAEQAGRFTIADVIEAIHTKMVRRHPHVFGDVEAATSADVLKNWEQLKAAERAAEGKPPGGKVLDESILAGIPRSLPATLEAFQLTRRAAQIGFDWDTLEGIFDKIDEEKHELLELRSSTENAARDTSHARQEEEVGDLLFAAINVARFLGIDPEIALKKANRKFTARFHSMEAAARSEGRTLAGLPRDRMEDLWNNSKSAHSDARGSRHAG